MNERVMKKKRPRSRDDETCENSAPDVLFLENRPCHAAMHIEDADLGHHNGVHCVNPSDMCDGLYRTAPEHILQHVPVGQQSHSNKALKEEIMEDVFGLQGGNHSIVDLFDMQDFSMMVHDMEKGDGIMDPYRYPYTQCMINHEDATWQGAVMVEESDAVLAPLLLEERGEEDKDEEEHDPWESTVLELRQQLRTLGLPVAGAKSNLVGRLRSHLNQGKVIMQAQEECQYPKDNKDSEESRTPVENMDAHQVQLKYGGEEPEEDLSGTTTLELRQKLKSLGLQVNGRKRDLIKRIRNHLKSKKRMMMQEQEEQQAERDSKEKAGAQKGGRGHHINTRRNRSPPPPPPPSSAVHGTTTGDVGYSLRTCPSRRQRSAGGGRHTSGHKTTRGVTMTGTRKSVRKREGKFDSAKGQTFPLSFVYKTFEPLHYQRDEKENIQVLKQGMKTIASPEKCTALGSEARSRTSVEPFKTLTALGGHSHPLFSSIFGLDVVSYPFNPKCDNSSG